MHKFIFALSLFFVSCKSDPKSNVTVTTNNNQGNATSSNTEVPEPAFVQEGVLEFHQPGSSKAALRLNIEIAHEPAERQQGLMYRKKMADTEAMLFVFDFPEPQSFWMRNTYISLDIIYINEKFEVVSVVKNIPTLNDDPRPSGKPAQYVVEVNAGLADKYHIEPGTTVSWADFVTSQQMGKNPVQTF